MCEIISLVRGEKSNNNLSLKTVVESLDISVEDKLKNAIESSIKDFKATLFIEDLKINALENKYQINAIVLKKEEENN